MPRGMVIAYLSYVAHKHIRLTLPTVLALLMKFCRGSCCTGVTLCRVCCGSLSVLWRMRWQMLQFSYY